MQSTTCSPDILSWLADRPSLMIIEFADPVIEAVGFDARSDFVETYWLPVLGPSALWALRRFRAGLAASPDGFTIELSQLARELGLGTGTTRQAPVVRAVGRLATFRMAEVRGDALAVRRSVPPLARRHLTRLPDDLADRHRVEMEWAPPSPQAVPLRR